MWDRIWEAILFFFDNLSRSWSNKNPEPHPHLDSQDRTTKTSSRTQAVFMWNPSPLLILLATPYAQWTRRTGCKKSLRILETSKSNQKISTNWGQILWNRNSLSITIHNPQLKTQQHPKITKPSHRRAVSPGVLLFWKQFLRNNKIQWNDKIK